MIDEENLAELAEALQAVADAWSHGVEELVKAICRLTAPFTESLVQALEDIQAGVIYTPRKPLPRPPKYAGPANKGRSWTRQPPRVARSSCRKMRR